MVLESEGHVPGGDSVFISEVWSGKNSENVKWEPAFQQISPRISRIGSVDTPVDLLIVWFVAGQFQSADWDGVRTGYFNKKINQLTIQVSFPESPPPDPAEFVRMRMLAAVDEAEAWAERRKIRGSFDALRPFFEDPLS